MKKMIVRGLALIMALVLVGSLYLTAFATETTGNSFNAGLSISTDSTTGVITVTVSEDVETAAVLADQKPKLAVVCTYADVIVTCGETTLDAESADGKVSFTVANTGSYTITPNYVAAIGETKYFSLIDAFADAADGSQVTLLKNVTIAAGTAVTIPSGITLVIPEDMTLTVDGKLTINGQLTNNGAIAGQSNIYCLNHTDTESDGTCDICSYYAGGSVTNNSLTLDGKIVQNYYTNLSDAEGVYMEFTLPDGSTEKVAPVWSEAHGMYVFSVGVAAKEMSATVTGTLKTEDGAVGQTYSYSNRAYADYVLNSDDAAYAAVRELVTAMLHYGTYAQKHFNYNTGNLANTGLGDSGIDAVTTADLSAWARPAIQNLSTVRFVGASMILESDTTLRLFFRINDSVKDSVTFQYGETVLTPTLRGSNYYVDIPNIAARDLDEHFTVTFSDGTNFGSVSYSPMTYCYTILKGSAYADTLKDLVKSMYLYNAEANEYFG